MTEIIKLDDDGHFMVVVSLLNVMCFDVNW